MTQGRQFCSPHLLTRGRATRLERVSLSGKSFDEKMLQQLLWEYPSLLPIHEIEPLFDRPVPLARELMTTAGPIDLVYVNADGYLTVVETKLWRNPEARRQVVAQIIDYATALSKWSYADLSEKLRRPGQSDADPVYEAVAAANECDRADFVDTVSRSLGLGRFLLLIVGDGIQEGVEHLAETLARSPQLGFSLALVELAVFRVGESADDLLIQPRTIARTREVVRAVVQLRAGVSPDDVKVSLSSADADVGGTGRRTLTEEVLIEKIAQATSKRVADDFVGFLRQLDAIGIVPTARDASLSLFWQEPNTDERFTFGSVTQEGRVSTSYVLSNYRRSRIDEAIGARYVAAIAGLVRGARVTARPTRDGKTFTRVLVGNQDVPLADLLQESGAWIAAIQTALVETEQASSNTVSSGV